MIFVYFHFQGGNVKNIDLKRGSKEKIFECYNQNYVDLSDCEI